MSRVPLVPLQEGPEGGPSCRGEGACRQVRCRGGRPCAVLREEEASLGGRRAGRVACRQVEVACHPGVAVVPLGRVVRLEGRVAALDLR